MSASEAEPQPDELSPDELRHFEARLTAERDAILARSTERSTAALETELRHPDEVDQASTESAQAFELRLASRDRKLLTRIERALEKIPRGEYGLCEGTGELIARARLEARPWARFSVAYKEELERERALHVDD